MAIDTHTKRAAAAAIKPVKKIIVPDGTLDVYDRQRVAWLYGLLIILRLLYISSVLDTALSISKETANPLLIASALANPLTIAKSTATGLAITSTLSHGLIITATTTER